VNAGWAARFPSNEQENSSSVRSAWRSIRA